VISEHVMLKVQTVIHPVISCGVGTWSVTLRVSWKRGAEEDTWFWGTGRQKHIEKIA